MPAPYGTKPASGISPATAVTPRGLYAITPDENDTTVLVNKVVAALGGGTRWFQYRNKRADRPLALAQARALCTVIHAHGARLVVNDDVALALAVGADGVHVGRDDTAGFALSDLRKATDDLPQRFVIGCSCYDQLGLAETATAAGVDYLAFGSFFPSATKPLAVRAPLELLHDARKHFATTLVAIGGITLENAPQLIHAGAHAVAVIADLFEAENISLRATQYQQLFARHV